MKRILSPGAVAVVVASFCAVQSLLAVDPPGKTPEPPSRPTGDVPRGGGDQNNMRGMIALLGPYAVVMRDVSEDQRASFRDAMESVGEDARDIFEKMRAARKSMEEAVFAEKTDEAAIKKYAAEVGELEGQLAVIRAKVGAKLRPMLTSEQLAKVEEARKQIAERGFMGRPGGGDGQGRRPGGVDRPGEARDPLGPGTGNNNSDVRRPRPPADSQK